MEWTFEDWKDRLELLSYIVVAASAVAGVLRYVWTTHRERLDREYGTYNALDEKYFEYTRISLEYPRLDLFEIAMAAPPALNAEEMQQQLAGFSLLIQIFERAYLMYSDHSDEARQRQWEGWVSFMRRYAERESFRRAWLLLGAEWDTGFQGFMNREVLGVQAGA